jgi:leucine dehydrogenase
MFDTSAYDGHEQVTHFFDETTGLRGIIAIHSTARGPAFGGCRAWFYDNDQLALQDALRLSRGMSYKNAVAGLPLGGGKAVIIRKPGQVVTPEQFVAFGRAVNRLEGRYITAEDVGVKEADMASIARSTAYVAGLPRKGAAAGGDPSPKTAYGVYCGVLAATKARLGTSDLKGMRIAVQGLGSVGYRLSEALKDAGARLFVSDINADACERARRELGAAIVAADDILFQDVDVIAPCALGGILNATTIPKIRASVIAGGANNQLAEPGDGQALHDRGILYAPDYVINAGGIICAAAEYLGTGSEEQVWKRVSEIEHTLAEIFSESAATNTPPHQVADARAKKLLAQPSYGGS